MGSILPSSCILSEQLVSGLCCWASFYAVSRRFIPRGVLDKWALNGLSTEYSFKQPTYGHASFPLFIWIFKWPHSFNYCLNVTWITLCRCSWLNRPKIGLTNMISQCLAVISWQMTCGRWTSFECLCTSLYSAHQMKVWFATICLSYMLKEVVYIVNSFRTERSKHRLECLENPHFQTDLNMLIPWPADVKVNRKSIKSNLVPSPALCILLVVRRN